MTETSTPRDRYRGSLLGLATGDALGAQVEFAAAGSFAPVTGMTGGGPHQLPAGAWTDDTSMALCLAESLIERRAFDPVDQLERYLQWHRDGHLSSIGRCFDIGIATRESLTRFERTREPFPGDALPEAAGNGGLMRLAPVPLAYARDERLAARRAAESTRTTHGAPQAIDASRWFAVAMVRALAGASKDELISEGSRVLLDGEIDPEIRTVVEGSYRNRQPPEIRGKGYVVPALEAALWALHSTTTFEDAVLAAVNLGDDADTTAAICGQLAGALYGVDAIPGAWLGALVMRADIESFADSLLDLAEAGIA